MGKSIALMVAVLGLLSGCVGEAWYVDSRFTPEERLQIQAAADSWEAIGGAPQDFIWRQKVTGRETGQRVIVRAREREAMSLWDGFRDEEACYCGVHLRTPGAESIILVPEWIRPEDFQMNAGHELGHALGLKHSESPDALMFHSARVPGPTDIDAHALMLAGQP